MKRSNLAQNRIEYIVFGNPKGARRVLQKFGYQPERDIEDMAEQVKELILDKRKRAVKALVEIHPDRRVLRGVLAEKANSEENSYCGCKNASYDAYCGCESSFNEQPDQKDFQAFIDKLVKTNKQTVLEYYNQSLGGKGVVTLPPIEPENTQPKGFDLQHPIASKSGAIVVGAALLVGALLSRMMIKQSS